MKTGATRDAPKPATLEIVHVPIESLNPAPYNPRQMPPEEKEKLKRSIQRFGFVEPLVVQLKGRVVIGGHQRLEAARPGTREPRPEQAIRFREARSSG